jgi:hypothetical protein
MKNIIIKKCRLCNSEFEVNINNKRSNKKEFCSSKCATTYNGLNNKGKTRSDEFKKLLSEKSKGVNNHFYGKKHSEKTINEMKESSKWDESKFRYCNMNDIEKQIFDGILISDGCISNSRISGRLTLGFKYKETLERIINDLKSLNFSNIYEYKKNINFNRKCKLYTYYHTKSNFYRDLFFQYERWYINKKKIIPNDFILTPLSCYWWYVCDGYISRNNIFLCTDSYEKNYLLDISNKINKLGFRNNITTRNRIRLFKKDSKNFLNWISIDNNINIQNEYLYKWNIKKLK